MHPSCAQEFSYDALTHPSPPTVFVQAESSVVCAASSPKCVYFISSILLYCFRFLLCFVSCLIPFDFVVSAWWVEPYYNAPSTVIRSGDVLLRAYGRASGTNITGLCCMSTFMWQWHIVLETTNQPFWLVKVQTRNFQWGLVRSFREGCCKEGISLGIAICFVPRG
jgi:hypothetical protein